MTDRQSGWKRWRLINPEQCTVVLSREYELQDIVAGPNVLGLPDWNPNRRTTDIIGHTDVVTVGCGIRVESTPYRNHHIVTDYGDRCLDFEAELFWAPAVGDWALMCDCGEQ